ncbi:hypothetical protein GUITHDRAFT_102053 [Guillardia theta CCMP2712]|uniref:Uncharacterized protein n=1 Tax=Guillardia theta (strain CCMP2712) TaxID=905079 RepID=L1JUR4_GUITC|nr:hypothetical protein GUITHDRAFT_102053 [Guillardia theta CCMP2712]EKX52152.1 hypothetical protein GUITHDRAFT_102053 [Guillardia theta CCMP2712]|eukprot:XP_005839132.1 hypothetical protein GUITHDRAFT_102053 [Guillardia theta CCMP2712]
MITIRSPKGHAISTSGLRTAMRSGREESWVVEETRGEEKWSSTFSSQPGFVGDAEIDVASIPDRKKKNLSTNQSVWKEAHEKFQHMVEAEM